jgi:hypothetical protein
MTIACSERELNHDGADNTDEEMIQEELSGKIIGPEWMCLTSYRAWMKSSTKAQ